MTGHYSRFYDFAFRQTSHICMTLARAAAKIRRSAPARRNNDIALANIVQHFVSIYLATLVNCMFLSTVPKTR